MVPIFCFNILKSVDPNGFKTIDRPLVTFFSFEFVQGHCGADINKNFIMRICSFLWVWICYIYLKNEVLRFWIWLQKREITIRGHPSMLLIVLKKIFVSISIGIFIAIKSFLFTYSFEIFHKIYCQTGCPLKGIIKLLVIFTGI